MTDVDTRDELYETILTVQCPRKSKQDAECSKVCQECLRSWSHDVLVESVQHIRGVKMKTSSKSNVRCSACALSKPIRAPQTSNLSAALLYKPVKRVYSDVFIPLKTESLARSKCSVLLTNDYIGYVMVHFMNRKKKPAEAVLCILKEPQTMFNSKVGTSASIDQKCVK